LRALCRMGRHADAEFLESDGSEADDVHELVGSEAGAADQGAVDVGLGDERREVVRRDAPAVLDLETLRDGAACQFRDCLPDDGDGRVGPFGSRGATRADGPDWLVGNHDGRQVIDAIQGFSDLVLDDGFGFVGFVLGQGFADTNDRYQRSVQSRFDLAIDQGVVFSEVLAALRVANHHVTGKAFKHLWRDLPGVGAFWLRVQVLGTDVDVGLSEPRRDGGKRRERWAHHAFDDAEGLEARQHRVHQRQAFGDGVVHLPVAGNYWLTRCRTWHQQSVRRAATPGRVLPSMNSRLAPPPVETWLSLSATR